MLKLLLSIILLQKKSFIYTAFSNFFIFGKIKNMPTIDQLQQEIANKQTELSNCSRDLKMLTTRRANQQRAVTRK